LPKLVPVCFKQGMAKNFYKGTIMAGDYQKKQESDLHLIV
jgi:hypothetical protein